MAYTRLATYEHVIIAGERDNHYMKYFNVLLCTFSQRDAFHRVGIKHWLLFIGRSKAMIFQFIAVVKFRHYVPFDQNRHLKKNKARKYSHILIHQHFMWSKLMFGSLDSGQICIPFMQALEDEEFLNDFKVRDMNIIFDRSFALTPSTLKRISRW